MITKYAGMLTALLGVHLFVAAQTEIKKITALRSGIVFKIDGNLTQIAVKYRQIEPHRGFQLFWMAACVLQI